MILETEGLLRNSSSVWMSDRVFSLEKDDAFFGIFIIALSIYFIPTVFCYSCGLLMQILVH